MRTDTVQRSQGLDENPFIYEAQIVTPKGVRRFLEFRVQSRYSPVTPLRQFPGMRVFTAHFHAGAPGAWIADSSACPRSVTVCAWQWRFAPLASAPSRR